MRLHDNGQLADSVHGNSWCVHKTQCEGNSYKGGTYINHCVLKSYGKPWLNRKIKYNLNCSSSKGNVSYSFDDVLSAALLKRKNFC